MVLRRNHDVLRGTGSYCLSTGVIKVALEEMIVVALLRLNVAEARSLDLVLPKWPRA